MTFYNIIFGFLFLASFRSVLILWSTPKAFMAATIALLIFNDAVSTSHVLEGNHARPYRLPMKLIDLVAFVGLSLAVISLDPSDRNPLQVDLQRNPILTRITPEWFWLILLGYWFLSVLFWNILAGEYEPGRWSGLLLLLAVTLPSLFVFMGMVELFFPQTGRGTWVDWAPPVYTTLYCFILKPWLLPPNAPPSSP